MLQSAETVHFFLLPNSILYMDIPQLVFSSVYRHLGCFQFLTITNKPAIDISS